MTPFRKLGSPLLTALLLAGFTFGCTGDSDPGASDTSASESDVEQSASPDVAQDGDTSGEALLDPEMADAEELAAVPHITPELADRLVAQRPYENMLEVDALLSEDLDEAQRDEVYRHLFKPLDLNDASEEEILLIPGVGDRMAHEFEEYRPYPGIQQFRREIGKYVDEAEVARLERYVRIS